MDILVRAKQQLKEHTRLIMGIHAASQAESIKLLREADRTGAWAAIWEPPEDISSDEEKLIPALAQFKKASTTPIIVVDNRSYDLYWKIAIEEEIYNTMKNVIGLHIKETDLETAKKRLIRYTRCFDNKPFYTSTSHFLCAEGKDAFIIRGTAYPREVCELFQKFPSDNFQDLLREKSDILNEKYNTYSGRQFMISKNSKVIGADLRPF